MIDYNNDIDIDEWRLIKNNIIPDKTKGLKLFLYLFNQTSIIGDHLFIRQVLQLCVEQGKTACLNEILTCYLKKDIDAYDLVKKYILF